MEKRISYFEFQSVRSVAKAIEPYAQKKERLIPQLKRLEEELEKKQQALNTTKAELDKAVAAINAYEAGIVNVIGFHANDLVKKIVETTEKDGKIIKTTKYVPTSIVSYDEATKQYVINTDALEGEATDDCAGTTLPPNTDGGTGTDFDADNGLSSDFEPKSETDAL